MPGVSEVDSKKKALTDLISQKDDLEALIGAYKSQAMFDELLIGVEILKIIIFILTIYIYVKAYACYI